jgi:hypothetical protein
MKVIKTYLFYYPIFWLGYLFFKISNVTNWYSYVSFRRLFVLTKGASNDFLSRMLASSHSRYPLPQVEGVLGTLSQKQVRDIADKVHENGFYIFNDRLSPGHIESLVSFAETQEAELVPPSKDGVKRSVYNRQQLLSPRYQFFESDILKNPVVQELTTDMTLFAVAQEYLGCKPIQDLTALWWSTAFSKQASSEAAQLFHFDMDRFKFIKFFFYLTDVDTNNGPHCFVRGSHRAMPANIWKDGRIQDTEIQSSFPKEDIVEITGQKGTIIAVDTRGLHKGKVLNGGERLILQFEFTNSLFGASYETVTLDKSAVPKLKMFFDRYSYAFQRFKLE